MLSSILALTWLYDFLSLAGSGPFLSLIPSCESGAPAILSLGDCHTVISLARSLHAHS